MLLHTIKRLTKLTKELEDITVNTKTKPYQKIMLEFDTRWNSTLNI